MAALLRWDISSIPAGVTVKSATITLNITTTSSQTYQLYELKQNWTESGAYLESVLGNQHLGQSGGTGGQ